MNTLTPMYDALIAETGFDPESVLPILTEADRVHAHHAWMVEAGARVAAKWRARSVSVRLQASNAALAQGVQSMQKSVQRMQQATHGTKAPKKRATPSPAASETPGKPIGRPRSPRARKGLTAIPDQRDQP